MNKFWNFTSTDTENESVLKIDGYIAEYSWFDDDVTPKQFAAELGKCKGGLTVWINSGGGDCFAASAIYTMLQEYKKTGKVSVKIDGLAASAASVIAMAGDTVHMSPTAMMMIHNPASFVFGDVSDLEHGIEMLNEVKESIINSYVLKTRLSRNEISKLMDAETWFNAKKAVEMGFVDGILYGDEKAVDKAEPYMWNRASAALATVNAMKNKLPKKTEPPKGVSIETLEKRLSLLKW